MRSVYLSVTLMTVALGPGVIQAQNFDTSGNSFLQGTYGFRQVASDNVTQVGTFGRTRSLTGTLAFDGNGNYTLTGQLSDNTVSSGQPQSYTFSGTYAVSSSGLMEMQSSLTSGDVIYGGVGASAFVGSSTEGNIYDVIIGVPLGSNLSNSSLQGQYRLGSLEYPGGDVTQSRNATFLINADGQGNLGSLAVDGHSVALGNTDTGQTIAGATYTLNSTNGTMNFPSSVQNQLISGAKQFYVSSDGNILVGGALNGYDMIAGIKASQGTLSNSTFSGFYYTAGADSDVSQASSGTYYADSYYGSLHVVPGTLIAHSRINPSNSPPYDYTADDSFNVGSGGSVTESYDEFFVGAGGHASLLVGLTTSYALELTITARTAPASGSVYLNPLAIVNAANYAPITNPVAPGEILSLYGTGLASSSASAQSVPVATSLGGVSVSINSRAAPILSISPTQVVCVVPYATAENYATIQLTNNGAASNSVTLYTEQSAPGVFTVGQSGIGDGAFVHASGALVSSSNPAKVGETIASYVTGLGSVNPVVSDGAAAPSNPLSMTGDQFLVYVDNQQATVTYSGLAPGFVGLYQVNFAVPTTPDTGEVYVDVQDNNYGGYTSMSTMVVSGTQAASTAAVKTGLHPGRILPEARRAAKARQRYFQN